LRCSGDGSVDEVCYLGDPQANGGDNHPGMASDCAATCAQKGSTVGVADNGKLYGIPGPLAADNNAKLVPHIAHTVEIPGDVVGNVKSDLAVDSPVRLRRDWRPGRTVTDPADFACTEHPA